MKDSERSHSQSVETIASSLSTDTDQGLSEKEARNRLDTYGRNIIEKKKTISPLEVFVRQFKDVIILLLLVAAVLSFVIGDAVEGFAVLAVIILTTIFGFISEYRAEKSVEALQDMITPTAKVRRDGELKEIDAAELVPGDIVVIEEGDKVTADGRLIEADHLDVEESMLTGESEPVTKHADTLEEGDIPLADRFNMVHMGTTLTGGNGEFIVTGTGETTEMGKISEMLQETVDETTPLEEQLQRAGKFLIYVTFAITLVVAVVGILVGRPPIEMIKTAIALAVAAVPEGLPAVATITLAIGMRKMAKKNALVKTLPAVETLGSTTVVATDKTGTLTENQMTLDTLTIGGRTIKVSGTGYTPEGGFSEEDDTIDPLDDAYLHRFLKVAFLSSNAVLSKDDDGNWTVIGDPTEGALVVAAQKGGVVKELNERETERVKERPFDSDTQYMAVLTRDKEGHELLSVKGAPTPILERCDTHVKEGEAVPLEKKDIDGYLEENQTLAQKGLRVLALAYKDEPGEKDLEEASDEGLTFLGFAGIFDPPRNDVKASIRDAQKAGIRILMITGDQPDTARTIAEKVGIEGHTDDVVMGSELDDLSSEELAKKLKDHAIYSRVSPGQKLTILSALNENSEITAMTGDGVNDAPALKRASIGVSMGNRGTAVAKEASDMVLLDDSFNTIISAVKYGRVILDNIQKFIHYLLSINLSEIALIFFAIILAFPSPLTAIQILWLNMITGVFPAFSLAWETPEERTMTDPPREPDKPIITRSYKWRIVFQGIMISLGPLLAYLYFFESNSGDNNAHARTIAFMTLAIVHLLQVFNARKQNGLGVERSMFKNPYLWGAFAITISLQLFAIYTPFMRTVLKVEALSASDWGIMFLFALLPIAVLQLIAFIRLKIGKPYHE